MTAYDAACTCEKSPYPAPRESRSWGAACVPHGLSLAVLATMLYLPGCGSNVAKNFHSYVDANVGMSDLTQARAGSTRGKKQRVTVLAYEDTSSAAMKNFNVKGMAISQLEDYLQKAGLQLVSRRGAESDLIAEERKWYKFFSASGTQEKASPIDADYAVMGIITSVDMAGSYVAPTSSRRYTSPAQCRYDATVTGTLRVYSVAESRILQTLNLRGSATKSEDTSSSACQVNANILPVIRNAVDKAFIDQRAPLQNLFAQRGFVIAKRVHKTDSKDTIFQVSLGKEDGVEHGTKIEVYTRFLSENKLTGESRAEERKVADGEATDFIGEDYTWITVSNVQEADQIKLGDHVKVLHKKTFLEAIKTSVPRL